LELTVDDDDLFRASISELLRNFRDALLALIPVADVAMIDYRDESMHRDWERLAECMFDVFVRSPVDSAADRTGRELPLARYDIDLDDYSESSWLTAGGVTGSDAIVRFLSSVKPFDTVQVVEVDPVTFRAGQRRSVPLRDLDPTLWWRTTDGGSRAVLGIEAVE
jgi:hypothetical protein